MTEPETTVRATAAAHTARYFFFAFFERISPRRCFKPFFEMQKLVAITGRRPPACLLCADAVSSIDLQYLFLVSVFLPFITELSQKCSHSLSMLRSISSIIGSNQ